MWSFFDGHIRCINLEDRVDRYKSSSEFFKQHDIPVKYFKAKRHPISGVRGCFESHISVIKEAYEGGANRVLIFEDDVEATDQITNTKAIQDAFDFMDSSKRWNLFYLGAIPNPAKGSRRTSHRNIYSGRFICCHAYVVSRKAMRLLKDLTYDMVQMPIDEYYVENMGKCYALYPTPFIQRWHDSDTATGGSYSWQRYSNPKMRAVVIRFNEMYCFHVGIPPKKLIKLSGILLLIVIIIIVSVVVVARTRRPN